MNRQKQKWKNKLLLFSLSLLGAFSLQPKIGQSLLYPAKALTEERAANPAIGANYYADNQDDLYYQGISDDMVGETLITALSTLTSSGFVNHSYSSLPDIYQYSDLSLSGNGKMRMAYTGTEVSFSKGSMPSNTNKEHVWPASWYGNGSRTESAGSPGADAHNVWPAASDLNSKRGSCAFDELSFETAYKCYEFGRTDWSYGTPGDNDSYVWSTAMNYSNGQSTDAMYPAKGHRGEIARILMYVATRYRNNTTFPVMLHDRAETLKSGRIGKLSTLLKWHYEEPPSEWEIKRNNEVASRWHHNRNPFIDHPEYAGRIYYYLNEPDQSSPTAAVKNAIETYGDTDTPAIESIAIEPKNVKLVVGASANLSVNVTPAGASKKVTWSSSDSQIASVNASGEITAFKKGTVNITATSVENTSIFDTVTVEIKELEQISLSGEANKISYLEGEVFDPTGLSVTATYSDQTQSDISIKDCEWLDAITQKTKLSKGTTSVICKYGEKTATYHGITVEENTSIGYQKITSLDDLEDGKYLIVYEDEAVALNGALTKLDSSNNTVPVSINGTEIAANDALEAASFTYSSKNGSFLGTGGKYVGHTSSSNDIADSNEPLSNDISFQNGNVVVSSGNYSLRFNSSSGQHRFRYYKSGQQAIQLYKDMHADPIVEKDYVRLDKSALSLIVGDDYTLHAEASGTIQWSTSNSQIVSIDQNGNLTAHDVGQATITAKSGTASATCVITVSKPSSILIESITLNYHEYTMKCQETLQLEATIYPTNATNQNVIWSSSDTNIAFVESDGSVLALNAGKVTITVKSADNPSIHDTCVITVKETETPPVPEKKGCGKASLRILTICSAIGVLFVTIFYRKKMN